MNRGRAPSRRGRAGSAAASGAGNEPSSSSSTPAPSSTPARGTTTTRGASRGATRAAGAPATARFRPKNIRRDAAEREEIARKEEEKNNLREAEERRARGRGRFRGRRSRGDAMGARGGRGRGGGLGAASGPFSSGMAGSSGSGGGGWFGGGGGGGGGGGFRTAAGPSRSAKSERGSMRFGQGADINRETRINADMLHVLTQDEELDSDDEAGMVALSTKPATSLPMGIYRREHKEAEIIVATTAELEAAENATGEEESLWVDGGSGDQTPEVPIPDQPPEEGVWDTGSKKPVKVKTEPGEEGDEASMMDIDPKMPDSPEEKKKKPVEIKVKKALPQDPEDGRIEADYNLLASELGTVTITDEKGETRTEGPLDKDGRLYLFQFPPLLPPLKASAASRKGKVKSEAQDFSMEDVPSANGGEVDLTTEKDGEEGLDADDPENEKGFMSSLMSQGGMIGQLKVRKSGKVEFDWGGRTLEMSSATSMNFLSTAVMLEENDEKPHPEVIGGSSVGMGKIMGRFILAPSWGEEEDWVVTEEDLRIPEPEAVDA